MLKIKDSVDLTELTKFGFKREGDELYCDFIPYEKNEGEYILISERDRKIDTGYVDFSYIEKMVDKIYDIIQAGLVEKVEE